MQYLRTKLSGLVPAADVYSSLTNMGVASPVWRPRCGLEHLTPHEDDSVRKEIAIYLRERAERKEPAPGPLNERSPGLTCLVLDFDSKGRPMPEADMLEIRALFERVARQHFSNAEGPVYLAKSPKGNYHIHLPNFIYAETNVASLLIKFVKAKCTLEQRLIFDCLDMAPIAMRNMRVFGTDNKELEGKGVYTVIYPEVVPFPMDMFIR